MSDFNIKLTPEFLTNYLADRIEAANAKGSKELAELIIGILKNRSGLEVLATNMMNPPTSKWPMDTELMCDHKVIKYSYKGGKVTEKTKGEEIGKCKVINFDPLEDWSYYEVQWSQMDNTGKVRSHTKKVAEYYLRDMPAKPAKKEEAK